MPIKEPIEANKRLINLYLILIVVNDVSVGCFSKGEHVGLQQSQLLSMIFMHMILMNGRRNNRNLIIIFSFFFFTSSWALGLCSIRRKSFFTVHEMRAVNVQTWGFFTRLLPWPLTHPRNSFYQGRGFYEWEFSPWRLICRGIWNPHLDRARGMTTVLTWIQTLYFSLRALSLRIKLVSSKMHDTH